MHKHHIYLDCQRKSGAWCTNSFDSQHTFPNSGFKTQYKRLLPEFFFRGSFWSCSGNFLRVHVLLLTFIY